MSPQHDTLPADESVHRKSPPGDSPATGERPVSVGIDTTVADPGADVGDGVGVGVGVKVRVGVVTFVDAGVDGDFGDGVDTTGG